MASKYIREKEPKNKKQKKSVISNEPTNPYHSKYVKGAEEKVLEEEKQADFEESGYIKGSKRVRSYQSKVDEENRKKREAFQNELERRRQVIIEEKRRLAEQEGRADFDAGDVIIDEAELELEMHREGPTDLATTDFDPIEYDVIGNALATGNESDELVAKYNKKNKKGLTVGKNPKELAGLKDNTKKSLASEEKSYQHSIIATVLAGVLLTLLAVVLQFASVHLPFMPSIVSLEFSALPELLAGIAYGPIIGVGVVIIKNLLHCGIYYLLHGIPSFVNEISNVILDVIFVFVTSIVYNYYKGNQLKKSLLPNFKEQVEGGKVKLHHRSRFIFIGGTFGSALVSIASLFSNVYLIFPLFVKFYSNVGINDYYFLRSYLNVNPNIENIMQGVLYYNVPYNFIRMYAITLVVAVLYKPLSPLLHGQLKRLKK